MTSQLPSFAHLLKWNKEDGVGYFPVDQVTPVSPYNQDYFSKYQGYAGSERGKRITQHRIDFVTRHAGLVPVVDIGIGSGQFIDEFGCDSLGFDVNPVAKKYLEETRRFIDPETNSMQVATFWDALEHIQDPSKILKNILSWTFVTIPIFRDYDHILASKHFRPDEHYWYFDRRGFIAWMWNHGFRVKEIADFEIQEGREDVLSFAFKRR